jgi:hypothetical protein
VQSVTGKKYVTEFIIFTREYTQCTAGYTFCFVVVVVGGGDGATFSQTWHYFSRQLIKHD